MSGTDLFLCLLAILFPPIAVWVKRGICSVDSIINIALSCLGYIPGLLHAWYIIARYRDSTRDGHYNRVRGDDDDDAAAAARGVTYYYVRSDAASAAHPLRKTGAGTGAGGGYGGYGGYGTIGVSSPAPMPSGASGLGSQFPAQQQHGKINPYAPAGSSAGGQGTPDGHLRVVMQTFSDSDQTHDGDDGNSGGGGGAAAAGHAPPSYTATVKGDHKIQLD